MSPSSTSVAEPTTTTAPAGVNGTPTPPDPQAQPPVDPEATLVPQPVAQLASVEPPKQPDSVTVAKTPSEPMKGWRGLAQWVKARLKEVLGLIEAQNSRVEAQSQRLSSLEASAASLDGPFGSVKKTTTDLQDRLAHMEATSGGLGQQLASLNAGLSGLQSTYTQAREDDFISPEEQAEIEARIQQLQAVFKQLK